MIKKTVMFKLQVEGICRLFQYLLDITWILFLFIVFIFIDVSFWGVEVNAKTFPIKPKAKSIINCSADSQHYNNSS